MKATKTRPLIDHRGRALRVMCRDHQRTTRMLSGKKTTCTLEQNGFAPGWTIGHDMHINSAQAPAMDQPRHFAVMSGICWHEFGHVEFTPSENDLRRRGGDRLYAMLQGGYSHPYYMAWNILEDQRIESLMVARYHDLKPYFIMSFKHYFLDADPMKFGALEQEDMFLFSRGRRYLPLRIRKRLRRVYRDQSAVGDICRIIDEYRTLNLFTYTGLDRAATLVEEFSKYLPQNTHTMVLCSGGGGDSQASNTPPADLNGLIAIVAAGKEGQEPSDQSAGAGNTNPDDVPEANDDNATPLDDIAEDAAVEVMKSSRVQSEQRQHSRQVKASDYTDPHATRVSKWTRADPDADQFARKLARQLQKVSAENDPGIATHQRSGRLNATRAMTAGEFDTDLFDRWEDGNTIGTDIELYVALDISSSMAGKEHTLQRYAWGMKASSDQVGAQTTVALYDGSHYIVYDPSDVAVRGQFPSIRCVGGTAPAETLLDAHRVLVMSARKARALIMVTDGDWYGSEPDHPVLKSNEAIIEDLNARGITTVLVYIGASDPTYVNGHSCSQVVAIPTADKLIDVYKDVLVKELKKK